jgi:hypothetical protein
MSGQVPVEVFDRDVESVVIAVTRGFDVPGRIFIEGATADNPAPDLKTMRISISSEGNAGNFPAGNAGPDGSFEIKTVYPGIYRLSIFPALTNAYIKSVQYESREVLNSGIPLERASSSPLNILISMSAGTIEGTAEVPNARVVLVPESSLRVRRELFKTVVADASGNFRIQGVAPGNYKLLAWEQVDNGAWLNADFLKMYEDQGMPVEIRESQLLTVKVQVIP